MAWKNHVLSTRDKYAESQRSAVAYDSPPVPMLGGAVEE